MCQRQRDQLVQIPAIEIVEVPPVGAGQLLGGRRGQRLDGRASCVAQTEQPYVREPVLGPPVRVRALGGQK